jgi:hypothetical protein
MFAVGDIVEIFAPQAGHKKYHLCICVGTGAALQFLYLNSDPTFDGTFVVDCSKVSCLPASSTGKTAFSFAILPRYNEKQLKLFKAKRLGEIEKGLAGELLEFAKTVKTLNSADRKIVITGLTEITSVEVVQEQAAKPAAE